MATISFDKTFLNVSKGTPPPVAGRFRLTSGKVAFAEVIENFLAYVVNGSGGSSKPILHAALEHPLQIILAFDSKTYIVPDHRDEVAAVISGYLISIQRDDKIDGALESFAARHTASETVKGKGKKGATAASGAGGGGGGGAGEPSADEVAGALGALGLNEDKIAAVIKSLHSSSGNSRSDALTNMTSFSLGGAHGDSPVLNARGMALVEDARVHDATVASLLRHYLADLAKHGDQILKGKIDEALQSIRDISPADQARNATELEKAVGFYASVRLSLQLLKDSLQKGTTDAATALDAKKSFQELRCTEASVQGWGTVFDQKVEALGQTAQSFSEDEVVEVYIKSFEQSKETWAHEVGRQIRHQMSTLKANALATGLEPPVFKLETVKLVAIEFEAASRAAKVGAERGRDRERSGNRNSQAKGQEELNQAAFVAKAAASSTEKKAKKKIDSPGELTCYICGGKHRFTEEHSADEIRAWKAKGCPKFGSAEAPSGAKSKAVLKSKNGGKPSVISGGAAEYTVCDGDSAAVQEAKLQLELVEKEAEVARARARLALLAAQSEANP